MIEPTKKQKMVSGLEQLQSPLSVLQVKDYIYTNGDTMNVDDADVELVDEGPTVTASNIGSTNHGVRAQ